MKLGAKCIFLVGVLQAMPAAAQLCVGAAYDQPLPGAVDVVMRFADVPSAQFPGIWQEGLINGNFYQIFSNRVAVLQPDRLSPDWSITVKCQQRPCLTTLTGNPPDAAKATSIRLAQCLVPPMVNVAAAPAKPKPDVATPKSRQPANDPPQEVKPSSPVMPAEAVPVIPEVKGTAIPKPNVVTQPAAPVPPAVVAPIGTSKVGTGPNEAAVADGTKASLAAQGLPSIAGSGPTAGVNTGKTKGENAVPATEVVCVQEPQQKIVPRTLTCGLSLVPPDTPEATLQRLLVLAGADPGPVDGAYGRKTQSAVLQVLGFAGRDLNLQQSIAAVDAYLCRKGHLQP